MRCAPEGDLKERLLRSHQYSWSRATQSTLYGSGGGCKQEPRAEFAHLGNLVPIDGSLIDAVLSMEWADYRGGAKKVKAHIGYDNNRGIPTKIYLTDGKEGERLFVEKIIEKGQTGVMDRGYQCYRYFDQWQTDEKK